MKNILKNMDEVLAAIVLLTMLAIAFANVIARKYLSVSFSFSEELTSKLFVLFSLLGAAIAAKKRSHLGLTIITDMFPKKIRCYLQSFGFALAVVFCVILTAYGIKMTMYEFNVKQLTLAMQWPEWIFGIYIPIGGAFAGLRFAIESYNSFRQGREEG